MRSSTLDKILQVTKKTKKERYSAAEKLRVYFYTVKDISAATVENNIALVSITPPND